MTSILKDFYRGDISPAERQMARNSELSLATDAVAKAEDLLEQTLPPELRPLLKKLVDSEAKLNAPTAETFYIDGFKTGARFVMGILDDACENLEPFGT